MITLTKDEMRKYVEAKLPNATIIEAKKIGNTIAVQGTEGEKVITFELDANGNEYIEREGIVSIDPETKEPGWILTKTGKDNQPVLLPSGKKTIYIVKDSKFKKLYEPSSDGPNLYSKKQIEKFIQSDEDITFQTENGEMVVPAGGYIKVSDLDRISGISEQSFNDTYVVVEPNKENDIDFDNMPDKEEKMNFANDNHLYITSNDFAKSDNKIISSLYEAIEKSFIKLIESYYLVKCGKNFYESKDFTMEQFEEEFLKRYKNFYNMLEKLKEEIMNLSEDEISVIRDKTCAISDYLEQYEENNYSGPDSIERRKRYKACKERIEKSSDKEMKEFIYLTMPFEWINKYHPYPVDGIISMDSTIEPENEEIENVYNSLCKNYYFKEQAKQIGRESGNGLYFENYDSTDRINLGLGNRNHSPLYPGIEFCRELFEKIEEKKRVQGSGMTL